MVGHTRGRPDGAVEMVQHAVFGDQRGLMCIARIDAARQADIHHIGQQAKQISARIAGVKVSGSES